MLWAVKQLLVPVSYLRIRHGHSLFQSKIVYDFIMPGMLTAATGIAFYYLDLNYTIFASSELVKRLLDLLALMIVFYMAALAAVSTFDRAGINERLKGDDALLSVKGKDGVGRADKQLTYRQFVSYLFGYLSFLSMCLYIFLATLAFSWTEITKHLTCSVRGEFFYRFILSPSAFAITFFAVWQLTITSLLGIYFLTERIQSLDEDR